jgi:hypothetical protein
MQTYSLSSYVEQRNPTIYGVNRSSYFQEAEKAIERGSRQIKATDRSSEAATEALFFSLLDQFEQTRQQIAQTSDTERSTIFGKNRYEQQDGVASHLPCYTNLQGYPEYNEMAIHRLMSLMKQYFVYDMGQKKFNQLSAKVEETVLGRKFSFEMKLMGGAQLEEAGWLDLTDTLEVETTVGNMEEKSTEEIIKDCALLEKLKAKTPDRYTKLAMGLLLMNIILDHPTPIGPDNKLIPGGNTAFLKSIYVIGTLRLQIGKQMVAIGKLWSWVYENSRNDPIDRMRDKGIGVIIHQDTFLIKQTLQEISKLFAKAVQWQPAEGLRELKNRVALFRFVYAYCMPHFRGDGAIGDWFDIAIYRSHGFTKTRHNSSAFPCYEPLAAPLLSHYVSRYDKTITVE